MSDDCATIDVTWYTREAFLFWLAQWTYEWDCQFEAYR